MVAWKDNYIIKFYVPSFAIVSGISSSDSAHNKISIKSSPNPSKLKYAQKEDLLIPSSSSSSSSSVSPQNWCQGNKKSLKNLPLLSGNKENCRN